jgi:putative inorganic carbon (hco3(-)) transporter
MSANKAKSLDSKSLSSRSKEDGDRGDSTLKPVKSLKKESQDLKTLENPYKKSEKKEIAADPQPLNVEIAQSGNDLKEAESVQQTELTYAERQKINKKQKLIERDQKLLTADRWLARNGHTLTYIGIFLFTLVVYFRPYELIPALSGFRSIALIIALATLAIYLPTQFSTEGTLTAFPTEVKCVLFMLGWAFLTIPIAKDPAQAWHTLNETFIKVVAIFIVMVNTLRTRMRLKGLMWLSIGVGVLLSFQAIDFYRRGEFKFEGYRVGVDFGGMFGNPNDMAIHLVIFIPVAVALGIASKNAFSKIVYFTTAALMVAGTMVTQSRGAFLGLVVTAGFLIWKLAKKQRIQVFAVSAVVGIAAMLLAPGNYGMRILSIFYPELDQVGSADQRMELFKQSILVTLRNPLGIGIGNFPVVGVHNLETHNAYTQVSSELGWLAFAVYVVLMISPIRKLAAIERQMFDREDASWMYFLSIGLQASIIAYMVSSFFGAVAYNWYVYYPIAYAICLRRIYQVSQKNAGVLAEKERSLMDYFKLQKA